jgi:hypothetical protein
MIRRWLAALLAMGCRSVRVAGNMVDQVSLLQENGYLAIGIASDLGFERLDVLDNAVVPVAGQRDAAGGPASVLADSVGLLIGDVPGDRSLFAVNEKTYLVTTHEIIQWSPVRPSLVTAVRGNRLDAIGGGEAALVATNGSCTFAENHCTLLAAAGGTPGNAPIAVALAVGTLVLSANQVVAPRADRAAAVDAKVTGATITGTPAITAVGNITGGEIRLNGGALPAPWAPLNIRTS